MQAYTSYNSVEQEYKGHLRIVEEKQKAQHALESSIADTERRIEGLRKKSEESQQARQHASSLRCAEWIAWQPHG